MSLRDRCIEADARARYEAHFGTVDAAPSWEYAGDKMRSAWRMSSVAGVDAVLAEVAAWCDDRAEQARKDGDIAEYGLRIAARKCREDA